MTQYINILIISILLSFTGSIKLKAQQNILDCENSRNFAGYLFNTGQFELAVHELERISFFCETDPGTQLILLQSYRKLEQFNNPNNFFDLLNIQEIQGLSPEYREEYVRLLMSQNLYAEVKKTIEQGLSFREKHEHLLGIELLEGNFAKAYAMSREPVPANSVKMNALVGIAALSYEAPHKKPWLAALMSALVPGTGKMYSGYWGDGIISLLFTASSSFFTYRAFNKYGSDKVYPWIAGGLAVSYYAGNIYGGHKAAVRHNNNIEHGFIHQTEQVLFTGY